MLQRCNARGLTWWVCCGDPGTGFPRGWEVRFLSWPSPCVGTAYDDDVTDPELPTGELRVVAGLAGRSLDETYRLFRLPGAPQPVAHVACVPVYDLSVAVQWLNPPAEPGEDLAEPQPLLEVVTLDVPRDGGPV